MSDRVLAEVVSQYVEASGGRAEDYVGLLAGHRDELEPLLGVIRLLRAILVPVEPSPAFAAALKASLMTIPIEDLPPANSPYPKRLVVGSIAFGSLVSAAAVYLLYARARAGRAA